MSRYFPHFPAYETIPNTKAVYKNITENYLDSGAI